MTVKSDEYRCEAYAILYSFHQSDNPIEAFAQGYEAGAKSREQVSERQIETVSRILYKCSFGFPFDEDSIDGMFDHAVQSGTCLADGKPNSSSKHWHEPEGNQPDEPNPD